MDKIRGCFDLGHGLETWSEKRSKGIGDFAEWDFNNGVVKYALPLAEYNGFEILLTQPLDSREVPLMDRIKWINEKHKERPIEFIMSFHADYNPNPNAQGHWVFHWYTSKDGKRLAEIWNKHATNILPNPSRGIVKSEPNSWTNQAINRETLMPSALMEHGFFSNEYERENLLKSEDFRKKCAEVAVRAACEFCGVEFKSLPSDDNHWSKQYFEYLNNNGLTIHEKRFDEPLKRGEFMKVIADLLKNLNRDDYVTKEELSEMFSYIVKSFLTKE